MVENNPSHWRHGQPCFPSISMESSRYPSQFLQLLRVFLDFFSIPVSSLCGCLSRSLVSGDLTGPGSSTSGWFLVQVLLPHRSPSIHRNPPGPSLEAYEKAVVPLESRTSWCTGLFPSSKTSQPIMHDIICITDFIFPAAVICRGLEYEQ